MEKIKWYKQEALYINIEKGERIVRICGIRQCIDGIEYDGSGRYVINVIVLRKLFINEENNSIKLQYGYYDEEENELYLNKPKDKMIGEWDNKCEIQKYCAEEVEKELFNFGKALSHHLDLRFFVQTMTYKDGYQENITEIDLK